MKSRNVTERTLRYFSFLFALLMAGSASAPRSGSRRPLSPIRFTDVAHQAGIDFVLENSPTPHKHMIETMPGGMAVFDYNGDGLPDIYFTNGAAIPSLEKDAPRFFNRLYRNDGGMKFTDVTAAAGVAGAGYSMGAAAGDYANDGHADLFVAGVFHNILYHNLGTGRFEDVTAKAGITSDKWAVAAGWFDYDNDGWLDLFVVNYAKWSLSDDRFCGNREKNIRIYCHPKYFEPISNTLYHNNGDGTFTDVTEKSGIGKSLGRGMSVAFADYDHDGYMDVFVTNDNLPNFLFRNKGNGTFEEVALTAGVALTNNGAPIASMGADFRDYDNDGWPDISVVALAGETFPLFRNLGNGTFEDATLPSRLATLSTRRSGWGTGFVDFNNDGCKDLFTSNAHVNDLVEMFEATHYKLPNSAFANQCDGTFQDMSSDQGADFQTPRAHRGLGFADFDRDGRVDVVVTSLGEPTELWHNTSPEANHWLNIHLVGTRSNRQGIGARIHLDAQYNEMTTAVGYASSSDQGVHFGLGTATKAARIEIRWPSGIIQTLRDVPADQFLTIKEE